MMTHEFETNDLSPEEMARTTEHFRRNQAIDVRLTWQDRYLLGATLQWKQYRQPNPKWDDSYCEFCFLTIHDPANFGGKHPRDCRHEGYWTTGSNDGDYWICQECFEDFTKRSDWHVL